MGTPEGSPATPPAFDEWCIVELLGHRRLAGRLREQTLAGAGFLRLDEPGGRTQLVSPGSVYAIHPTTREVVHALAEKWRTEPVQRWELPAGVVQVPDDLSDLDDEGPF